MVHPGTLFHRRQRGIPTHSYENRSEIRALADKMPRGVKNTLDPPACGAPRSVAVARCSFCSRLHRLRASPGLLELAELPTGC
jgi:hypothetical protein